MTANFLSRIYNRIKCPTISLVFGFTVCFIAFYLCVNYFTKYSDYSNSVEEDRIIKNMRQIALECGDGYSVAVMSLKSNDPRMYIFKDVVAYNKTTNQVRSIKFHNSYYIKAHNIDLFTFNLFSKLQTGDVYTPDLQDLKSKSITFKGAFEEMNSIPKSIALTVFKYSNGNIKYVFSITTSKEGRCNKQDIANYLVGIVSEVANAGAIY